MKVTVLVENTSMEKCAGEHGLSLLVEHYGKNYLIDTGASGLYSENAIKMGVDLAEVDMAFLSHAHYDHSGGYDEFFRVNDRAKVYLQEACKAKFYYKIAGPIKKYIGIPQGILEKYEGRFEYVKGYRELGQGVFICPHTTVGLESRGKRAHMYGLADNEMSADDFSHEQTIVFEEENRLYLFNSCSHGGVENIMKEVKEAFPGREIGAYFGGFHMMGALGVDTCNLTEKEVKDTAKQLLQSSSAVFYTGHCTGRIAEKWLKEVLKERLVPFHSGMVIEI